VDISIITIFPDLLAAILGESMMKRADECGAANFKTVNLRDFTDDRHRTTDERPYGGGPGMVMKAEPIFKAVRSELRADSRVILMCPQGRPFRQRKARELAQESHLIFICPHYEGIDERVREHLVDDEISIGDYILTNGILPAAVVIDATVRLLPGVLGCGDSAIQESFSSGLLEYPQYTRPEIFEGMEVPPILLSGNHELIAEWRNVQSHQRTAERRPDLLSGGTDDLRK
jgi:tRNA (guanine37-N1)-methyltransferase